MLVPESVQTAIEKCSLAIRTAVRKAMHHGTRIGLQLQNIVIRTGLVTTTMARILNSGLRASYHLRRRLGPVRFDASFPDLQPTRLFKSTLEIVPLIWRDTFQSEGTQIPRRSLVRHRRSLKSLPRKRTVVTSAVARRLLQASFLRSASAIMGQAVPAEMVREVRSDRCLRDLLLTWLELSQLTSATMSPSSLLSALGVHASIALPPGDRLPPEIVRQITATRAELEIQHQNATVNVRTESLRRQLYLISSRLLAVPKILDEVLEQQSEQKRPRDSRTTPGET